MRSFIYLALHEVTFWLFTKQIRKGVHQLDLMSHVTPLLKDAEVDFRLYLCLCIGTDF